MVDLIGILAGVFVVLAFYETDHVRLRRNAIVSNILFVVYALQLGLWPVVLLHALLLPLNCKRLSELQPSRWSNEESLYMSESERQVFLQGLQSNSHSWAMYGMQRT
ncbi:MAG: hypothetical protein AAFY06_10125 [Pseudomonadota bacterium]